MSFSTTATYKSASALNTAMAGVYKHMFFALVTSFVVSFAIASSPEALVVLFGTGLKWLIIFAPLAAVFAITMVIGSVSSITAFALLHGFAALMGLSMSAVIAAFTTASVVNAFASASVIFAIASGYGYFTKRDLDSIGKWLIAGVIALIIVSIVNLFIGSSPLTMVISAVAVVLFTGLTAYDTQNIRNRLMYENVEGNVEIIGALSLYINFINIFISLLQLFGNRE